MACKHKRTISLYGRGEKKWISTKTLCKNMYYVCEDCGALLEKRKELRTLKFKNGEKTND